ncbi:MAG: Hsp33 family molecular chaperone HslO [Pseudomonadales bacterium]|nr:Hsp33 family molecular chaperone HslO [Pseudomonadales bacterium]
MNSKDYNQRFIFEDLDIRGEFVHIETSYQTVLSKNDYPEVIQRLLGELVCASVLLSSILKYEGRLAIHAQSEGPIRLLVAECSNTNGVRAIAHFSEESLSKLDDNASLNTLIPNGKLAIMIQPTSGKQYQGIVPLSGNTLAECLEGYFEQSEQLPTRIYLAADQHKAGGLLLQQLPGNNDRLSEEVSNQWEHITTLASTTRSQELTELSADTLLSRLFAEETIRAFEPQSVSFQCRCSREKTRSALAAMGRHELEDIIEKKTYISVDCQFCTTRYRFTRDDLDHICMPTVNKCQAGTLH